MQKSTILLTSRHVGLLVKVHSNNAKHVKLNTFSTLLPLEITREETDKSAVSVTANVQATPRQTLQQSISILIKLNKYKEAGSRVFTFISEGNNDIRLWIQFLKIQSHNGDYTALVQGWREMLHSGLVLESPRDMFWRTMWTRMIVIGRRYPPFLNILWKHAEPRVHSEKHLWMPFYDLVIGHLLQGVSVRECSGQLVTHWHDTIFPTLKPVSWDFLCKSASKSVASLSEFRKICESHLGAGHPLPSIYELVPLLLRKRSYQQALKWNNYLISKKGQLSDSIAVNPLLKHLVSFSTRENVERIFQKLIKYGIPVHTSTLDLFGSFYAGIKAFRRLPELVRIPNIVGEISQEFWCIWLSAEYPLHRKYSYTVKEMVNVNAKFGNKCIALFIKNTPNRRELEYKMCRLQSKNHTLSSEIYAALVRCWAKNGDTRRALSTTELSFGCLGSNSHQTIARNLCIGLLQNQSFYDLERFHKSLVDRNIATVDTWNLLLRSRVQRKDQVATVDCLQEMETLRIPVENASATELRQAILRPRKRGERKSTPFPDDTRHESEDVTQAVAMMIRCMKLGGRVQPEAWRELLLRIVYENDFAGFYILSTWLISQYKPRAPGRPHQSLVTIPCALHFINSSYRKHPLRRLFTRSLLSFVIASGFLERGEKEVLDMVLQWKLAGVFVDFRLVSRATAERIHSRFPQFTYAKIVRHTKKLLAQWKGPVFVTHKSFKKIVKQRLEVAEQLQN